MNLAVNARDAMPGGGHALDRDVQRGGAGRGCTAGAPASRVMPSTVRDTGDGMDETTRGPRVRAVLHDEGKGRGTGLGLSTVYGIVKQSGGHIAVESARRARHLVPHPAPRAEPPGRWRRSPARRPAAVGGGETVLVVEDEPAIRALACEMLQAHGYQTLSAGSGEEALGLAVRHAGPIDLLLTDVVMPGLAGPALAERFAVVRPHARVLYMSGYAGDDLLRHGLSEDASLFVSKPFTADLLGRRVREALDG